MINRIEPGRIKATLLLGLALFLLLGGGRVLALGVGSATVDSYIGETLAVSIPLFSVSDPEQLKIELDSTSLADPINNPLLLNVDQTNNQLSIKVRTEWLVNEPYLSFTLLIADSDNSLTKEFTVLLNLAPGGQPQRALRATNLPAVENARQYAARTDVMGPYEWAQAGQVPATFGPVIDGQSLWRVARRINEAMGVSLDQMMYALYAENPEAFSGESVDSLLAGSVLKIPSYEFTTQLSEVQAQQRLQQLSGARETRDSAEQPDAVRANDAGFTAAEGSLSADGSLEANGSLKADGSSSADGSLPADGSSLAEGSTQGGSQPFQMTGITEPGGATAAASTDEPSQEIISSLAVTVGNLTQELIRKDKKIQFLEEKVELLEGLSNTQEAANTLAITPADTAGQISSSTPATSSRLWWLLLILGMICAAIYLWRERLVTLVRDLNLFGSNDDLEFEASVIEISSSQNDPKIDDDKNDDSILAAVQKAMQKDQDDAYYSEFEEIMSVAELEPEFDSTLEIESTDGAVSKVNDDEDSDHTIDYEIDVTELDSPDESELSFDERMDQLLVEKDFKFARELMEFARHNDIDEARYHYERLRLLAAMENEEAFYHYFHEIEPKMMEFSKEVQKNITNLETIFGNRQP